MDKAYWWEEEGDNLHEGINSYLDELQKNQVYRESMNEQNLRLYGSDVYAQSLFNDLSIFAYDQSVQYNIIRSVCDTMTSTIAHSSKPTPFFKIHKGDWSTRRRAQKLERFVKGQMSKIDFYHKARRSFHDGTIFGTGCLHFFSEKDNPIVCEKVWPGEIVVDEMECIDTDPFQIHRVKPVHRNKLAMIYPNDSEAIERAERWEDNAIEILYPGQDMVRVTESIHLPTSKGSGDGKIARVIQGATLYEDEYTDDFFPYAFFRWSQEPRGFWGRGVAQMITGIQVNLNILLLSKAEMLRYTVPKILVHKGSGIKANQITNRIGGAYNTNREKAIEVVKLGTVPPEITAEEANLYQKGFELPGVSQLTAISKMPSRLDSSLALNEALNIQSLRFSRQYAEWHKFIRTCTMLIISFSDKANDTSDSFKTATKWKGRTIETDYKDAKLDPNDFSIEVREVQETPDTPWGITEILQQFLQAGVITPSQFVEYNWSGKDLEGLLDELNADENNIEWTLENMIEKDEYKRPEAFQNIPLGIKKMQKAYLNLKPMGCPEEKLELIRNWISQAQEMERKKKLPLPNNSLDPVQAIASPETPPESSLLPLPTAPAPESVQ